MEPTSVERRSSLQKHLISSLLDEALLRLVAVLSRELLPMADLRLS